MPARPHRARLSGFTAAILLAALTGCVAKPTSLPPGSVLFQDDFERQSSGWPIQHTSQAILDYGDGHYAILVLAPNATLWGTPGLNLGAVRLEVDALHIAGPDDNLFGLVCRYRDDDNFVFLVASSDGFAGIGQYRNGERSMLSGGAMLPAEPIAPRGYSNHLAAECLDDSLRLFINGSPVAEAVPASSQGGDVGLIAGAYAQPGVEIFFDNFSVRVPDPSP